MKWLGLGLLQIDKMVRIRVTAPLERNNTTESCTSQANVNVEFIKRRNNNNNNNIK